MSNKPINRTKQIRAILLADTLLMDSEPKPDTLLTKILTYLINLL